jgi:hypothetical protein
MKVHILHKSTKFEGTGKFYKPKTLCGLDKHTWPKGDVYASPYNLFVPTCAGCALLALAEPETVYVVKNDYPYRENL